MNRYTLEFLNTVEVTLSGDQVDITSPDWESVETVVEDSLHLPKPALMQMIINAIRDLGYDTHIHDLQFIK